MRHMRSGLALALATGLAMALAGAGAGQAPLAKAADVAAVARGDAERARVKLVLFVVVDQLRGDLPQRYADRLGGQGLGWLMQQGLHYRNAHYRHANTATAAGHATLSTGANAPEHGMAGNDWFDGVARKGVYCVQDRETTLVGLPPIAANPDAAKPPAPTKADEDDDDDGPMGMSPRNLLCGTIADELVLASGGRSRVFGVCTKDRGSILLTGHLGQAYWYDWSQGVYVTSTYYRKALPAWAKAWNDAKPADAYRGKTWDLSRPIEHYRFRDRDDQPWENPQTPSKPNKLATLGRTFPHKLDTAKPKEFYSMLGSTPMTDEMTIDFAKRLLVEEKLGQGAHADMLCVSLSSTDGVGHAFGPDSLEAEDNMFRLNQRLAELFAAVDQAVGLDRTLIALSADHGVDEPPEYKHALRCAAGPMQDPRYKPRSPGDALLARLAADGRTPAIYCCNAGRLSGDLGKKCNEALRTRFRLDADAKLLLAAYQPNLHLDEERIAKAGLKLEEVERALAEFLRTQPGVAMALTRTDVQAGRLPDSPIAKRVARGMHPTRSGHVYLVLQPGWYPGQGSAATHGAPYAYDTFVPVIFAGPGVKPGASFRLVGPEDVAPTLSAYLGLKPPSAAVGGVLPEVLGE